MAAIRARWSGQAPFAVILGTGLGELADDVDAKAIMSYRDIPGFPRSTALAHKGRLVCGTLGGRPIIVLQGRCHLYEGYRVHELCIPVRVLASLGVQTLVVTNAAGGLNPGYSVGDVMAIDDHICLMGLPGLAPLPPICRERIPRARTRLYDEGLIRRAIDLASASGFQLQCGVYVGVTGPSYETRAEYRAFRRIGGDCVGMSTVPEVLTAAGCGMRVLGLSTVTNVARPDAPEIVSADEVAHVAATTLPKVRQIVHGLIAG
ncbi:MAG: purine-nucleoside phosphorylase [Planctomycetaceae bacterium]|nr:purine-nucleoside phosphorylase [Planctomycetaceae bacterium]